MQLPDYFYLIMLIVIVYKAIFFVSAKWEWFSCEYWDIYTAQRYNWHVFLGAVWNFV